ncbi:MAG TPA: hypothetical protein VGF67_02200 [Ktedonobacteraceae bacterium]|jgi:hypothetical protein
MPHHFPALGRHTFSKTNGMLCVQKRDNRSKEIAPSAGRSLCAHILRQVAGAQSLDTSSQLVQVKYSIIAVQDLEQRGLMTPPEADKTIAFYVAQASQLVEHPMTVRQIMAVPDPTRQLLTPLQEFAGAITFLNIMLVLAHTEWTAFQTRKRACCTSWPY